MSLKISNQLRIGSNDQGYAFEIGQLEDGRWIGYSIALLHTRALGIFIFPEVADGYVLGVEDREQAIRMTAAVAQDCGDSYGGVDRWNISEEQRGDTEQWRCAKCGRICCGDRCEDYEAFSQSLDGEA